MGSLEVLKSVNHYTLHKSLLMAGLRKYRIRRLNSWPYSFIFPNGQLHLFKDETRGKIKTHFSYGFLSFETSGACKPFLKSLPVVHKLTGFCVNSKSRQTQLGALNNRNAYKLLLCLAQLCSQELTCTLLNFLFPELHSILSRKAVCGWFTHHFATALWATLPSFSMNFPFPVLLHYCTVPTWIGTSSWSLSSAFYLFLCLRSGGSQMHSKCYLGFSGLGKALFIQWVTDKNEIIWINVYCQI